MTIWGYNQKNGSGVPSAILEMCKALKVWDPSFGANFVIKLVAVFSALGLN